jgi:glutamate carboxypeptidase
MFDVTDLYRQLQGQQPAMVAELERYVAIESGSHDKDGVDRAGAALAESFQALGFTIERASRADGGDHLIARRCGAGQGRLLALIHLDTVWPRGTLQQNPFRIEDGKAYGPGVLDMKGGWVVLLSALRVLHGNDWDGLGEVTVFMTADEELGSPSGRPLIEAEAGSADWVVVMEPARENGALVTSRGMVGALYLSVRGATAHTGAAGRGASAIEEIAHKIIGLQALTDHDTGVIVSVGTVRGGSARQVIPDEAEISIDVRAPSTRLADVVLERIRAVSGRQHVEGTTTALTGGMTRPAFDPNPGTRRLFELAEACGAAIGLHLLEASTRAGSDGSFTAALGVPTLDGLGPEGANVCSRDEYVVVDSLPRRAALLAGIMSRLPTLGPGH